MSRTADAKIDYVNMKQEEVKEWLNVSEAHLRELLYAEMQENVKLREEREKLLKSMGDGNFFRDSTGGGER